MTLADRRDDAPEQDPAEKHATFLRSVLALDSSDPHLPRFVPPADAVLPDPAPPANAPNEVTMRTWRLMSRLRPRRSP